MKKAIERGLGDSTLMALWRRAVLRRGGYRCRHCGGGGVLQAHHCVHRGGHKLLLWDVRNGVPVHAGECHEAVNLLGIGAARPEDQQHLINTASVTMKQYLFEQGMTEAEWRAQVKAELLREINA